MTDTTTSPSGTVEPTPMSFDQGVDAIAGLLNDVPDDQDHIEAEVATSEPEAVEAVTEDGEEELVLDDVELEGAAETEEAPPAAIGDDYEVTLEDGQKISLGELKRNNLFQRDYSRKTEELKQQRLQLQEEYEKRVSEAEAEIQQKREFILRNAQRFMPKEPDPAMMDESSERYDPIGYLHAQRQYEHDMNQFRALAQQDHEAREAERQRQEQTYQATVAQEREKLFTALPKLKDDKVRAAFFEEAVDIGGTSYQVTPDEIKQIADHRYMRILHDAIEYRKAVAKAAAVKKEVAAKPKLVQQQRMAPQAVQERDRQGKFKALRETGSIDAAARAIEALL